MLTPRKKKKVSRWKKLYSKLLWILFYVVPVAFTCLLGFLIFFIAYQIGYKAGLNG